MSITPLSDLEFCRSLRWRLGLPIAPVGQRCLHQALHTSKKLCTFALDPACQHAVTCKLGGGPINIMHKSLASVVCTMLHDAGCEARIEVPIPEFHRLKRVKGSLIPEDAIMDVQGWSGLLGECLLDVSVRHHGAARYVEQAHHTSGYANSCAEKEKHTRYPDAGGRRVICAAVETFGRVGPEFLSWMESLSSIARVHDRVRGLSAQRYLQKWRSLLSTTLARSIVQVISSALVTDGGSAART